MSKLSILVNGREIDTYLKDGKIYVEGRRGKEYEIQYQNYFPKRQKIVLSVDGLNVITGDSTWERGYILPNPIKLSRYRVGVRMPTGLQLLSSHPPEKLTINKTNMVTFKI